MVARLSSLVFLGDEICHDEKWLDVSVNYTIDSFVAARALRQWPAALRPLVHWFLPSLQRTRKHMQVAREIIDREIAKRGLVQGKIPEKPKDRQADALDWSHEVAAGRLFDATRLQVGLSLAAIHTTSNLLTNVMYDLAAYQEYIQPLRDEIKAVIEEDGVLQKTSLTKLKLMDSVLKETQRVNPVSMSKFARCLFPLTISKDRLLIVLYSLSPSLYQSRDPAFRWNYSPQGRQHSCLLACHGG